MVLQRETLFASKVFEKAVHDHALRAVPMTQRQDSSSTNLPRPLNRLIGREQELREIKELLATTPLLTLTGAGGCGKTRLALQLGRDASSTAAFKDGVWWVELADLTDPVLLPQQIASALGLVEQAGRRLTGTLLAFLQSKELLLMLDNCEHLVTACAHLVERLLRTCPGLRILATSREALNIPGELVWLVPSLPLPQTSSLPPLEELVQYGAIQLFIERATAVLPPFTLTAENAGAVLQICRRLDGIPLATELAAARVKLLSVEQIAARLDDAYRLLTGGPATALPRHQTLRATMDWSYSLLSEQERILFRRLSVFAGGFTLEAAEAVCTGEGIEETEILDALSRLVDKSLVIVEERGGEGRYRLLETIRQYSQERLWEAGEVAHLQERHWNWYTGLVERAGLELIGPQQVVWFNRFEREHDNLRAALRCLLERGEAGIAARIGGGAFWHFWLYRGYLTEGRNILEPILRQYSAQTSTRAWVLLNAGVLAYYQNDFTRANILIEECLALSRALSDRQLIAYVLNTLGYLRHSRGDDEQATTFYEECLPLLRELGDKYVLTLTLSGLGLALLSLGKYKRARTLCEESLALARELGTPDRIAASLTDLALAVLEQGNDEQARALCEESLVIRQQLGHKGGYAHTLSILGRVALHQGDVERATRCYHESLALRQETGEKEGVAAALEGLARVAAIRGQSRRAAQLYGAAEALRDKMGTPLPPTERTFYEHAVAAVRADLDESAFAQTWAEGRAMELSQAMAAALEVREQFSPPQAPPTALASPAISQAGASRTNLFGLTARELEVLQLVTLGLTDAQIAEKLVISPRTAEAHVRSFLSKLGVSSRTAATRFAIAHQLVSLDTDQESVQ
jgi:predicted ATPase/DNA-binding CsgD family transcriptional regulator